MRIIIFVVINVLVHSNILEAAAVQNQNNQALISEGGLLPPEQENFPEELNSTNCGDVLVAKTGFINYKSDREYSNNERCIWIVRTPKWETRFLMRSSEFHSVDDHVTFYNMREDGTLQKKDRIDASTGLKWIGVIGPTVIVSFTSDKIGTGKGFLLQFLAFGYNEISGYVYNHTHLESPTGRITWPEKPEERFINTFSTFVLSPTFPSGEITLMIDKVDLMSLSLGCQYNYLSVHQLFQNVLALRLRYCEAEMSTLAKISSTSPLLITYSTSWSSKQKGISFSWYEDTIIR